MKLYNELKKNAETIRDETSSGANTAARVGGHLTDMVETATSRIITPIPTQPYKHNVPTIFFKYDFVADNYMGAHAAFKAVNGGVDLPVTYFIPPQWINRGAIKEGIADITFTAAVFDGDLITTKAKITIPAGGLSSLGLEKGMVVSFSGTSNNNGAGNIIDSITDTEITVYEGSGLYSGVFRNKTVTAETISSGNVDMYLGKVGYLTYANLATLIGYGDHIGTYSRNNRAYGSGYGWTYPDDETLWSLTYTARQELQAGIRAAGANLGISAAENYVVDMYVCPTYQGGERAAKFLRQAGFKGGTMGLIYNVPKNVCRAAQSPFNINEVGNGAFACAEAVDTNGVTGTAGQVALEATDGSFVDLEVGDPIVIIWGTGVDTKHQFRIVATKVDSNNITVSEAWDVNISPAEGAHWYDPLAERVDPAYGTGDTLQPLCGDINEMLKLGSGKLCIAGHAFPASATALKQNLHGIALQYANWLNTLDPDLYSRVRTKLGLPDNGEPIDILAKGMSEAIDDYYPNYNAGVRASISDAGAHIDSAYSSHFILDIDNSYNVQLGYNAGRSFDSNYRVNIGYESGLSPRLQTLGDTNYYGGYDVSIGWKAGYNASAYQSVFLGPCSGYTSNTGVFGQQIGIGYQALYGNTGRYSVGIGAFALKNNSGAQCVAIGYGAGSGNTETGLFTVHHSDINDGSPLVKGYFATGAIILGCPATAVANGLMGENRFTFYLDETTDKLKFKVRYQDSGETPVYKTGEIALT